MIDIAPKALRFARLAAEQRSAFADDPQVAVIRRQEETLWPGPSGHGVRRYVGISETTAAFCVCVITAFLERPSRFQSPDWDGNDFTFLQATAKSLREQLARPLVQGL